MGGGAEEPKHRDLRAAFRQLRRAQSMALLSCNDKHVGGHLAEEVDRQAKELEAILGSPAAPAREKAQPRRNAFDPAEFADDKQRGRALERLDLIGEELDCVDAPDLRGALEVVAFGRRRDAERAALGASVRHERRYGEYLRAGAVDGGAEGL